jgi:hypothetical protein
MVEVDDFVVHAGVLIEKDANLPHVWDRCSFALISSEDNTYSVTLSRSVLGELLVTFRDFYLTHLTLLLARTCLITSDLIKSPRSM